MFPTTSLDLWRKFGAGPTERSVPAQAGPSLRTRSKMIEAADVTKKRGYEAFNELCWNCTSAARIRRGRVAATPRRGSIRGDGSRGAAAAATRTESRRSHARRRVRGARDARRGGRVALDAQGLPRRRGAAAAWEILDGPRRRRGVAASGRVGRSPRQDVALAAAIRLVQTASPRPASSKPRRRRDPVENARRPRRSARSWTGRSRARTRPA